MEVILDYFNADGRHSERYYHTSEFESFIEVCNEVRKMKQHPGLKNRWTGMIMVSAEPYRPYIINATENQPIEGEHYWVKTDGGDWFMMIRRENAAGGWTNGQSWEDDENMIAEYIHVPQPKWRP